MRAEYAEGYERLERDHWWWLARRRILREELDRLSPGGRGPAPSQLDIGGGAGLNLGALKGTFDCVGVEPYPVLAEAARRNTGLEIVSAELAPGLSLGGRAFDFVLLMDVLEHIDDDAAALRAASGALKDGGYVVVNVPAMPSLWSAHDLANEHRRRYTLAGLKALLASAGLREVSARFWGHLLVPLGYARRLLARPSGRPEDYVVRVPPRAAGRALESMTCLEYRWTSGLSIPFGLSLLAVGQRRGSAEES
jgi:SAM-dependent methyltransferase